MRFPRLERLPGRRSGKRSGKDSTAERTRRRFARRQWARRWLTWRYVVAVVVVLALVGGAIYAVYFSSALSVQGVEVSGAKSIEEKDVLAAADVPLGGPLATVDLVAIERRVAAIAEVRSVEVTRKWPHDVLITVTERQPVAVVRRGTLLRAVDVEGVLFGSPRQARDGLPLIESAEDDGEDPAAGADPDVLKAAVTVVAALPDELATLVDHVEVRSADQIDLVLRDERIVRWGSAEASKDKGEIALALLAQKGRVYDVSVPGQPTIKGPAK